MYAFGLQEVMGICTDTNYCISSLALPIKKARLFGLAIELIENSYQKPHTI
jgi:hypothetical protein